MLDAEFKIPREQFEEILTSNGVCTVHGEVKIGRDIAPAGIQIKIDKSLHYRYGGVVATKVVVERNLDWAASSLKQLDCRC